MKRRICLVLSLILCAALVLSACGGGKSKDSGPSPVNSPADFPGHKIAVQVDTTADDDITEMAEADSNIKPSRYEKVTQCFDDLALGRVDAVYVDIVVAGYYTMGSEKYKIGWVNEETEPLGICLRKDSADLHAAIEAALDTMYFDGSMAEIAKTHFGDDLTAGLRNVTAAPVIPSGFKTKADGKLMVGLEVGYPPMEYKAENGVDNIGFDIDVAMSLGRLLGLEVQFVDTAWDGIFFALEKGEYDCIISSVSITEPRQEKYLLTEPYVSNALSIVVLNN